MIHLSSFQFENENGEVLQVEIDSKSKSVKLKSDAGFTITNVEDLEEIINKVAEIIVDLKEINRKK